MNKSNYAILTLYYIPSPVGIDWTSPTTLARTIVKNKLALRKRFMGHVNIGMTYSDGKRSFLTGITGNTKVSPRLILKEGYGLGILYHSYDGSLESEKELDPELNSYFKAGNKRINFSRYIISIETAQRVEKYLSDFREKKLDRYYGLVNNPLRGEGSGCSAFGASFLRVAGLMDDEYQSSCSHNVTIPEELAGAPLYKKKVNFLKMLFKKYSWSKSKSDYSLFFWDPDLMHTWVESKIKDHNDSVSYKIINIENSTGIEFDCTNIPTPDKDIFTIDDMRSKLPDLSIKNNNKIYCE